MATSTTIHNLILRRAPLVLAAMAASLLTVIGSAALPAHAQSTTSVTTITVNTNVDEANTDDDCSLREAIQAANTNAAVDACPAGSATEEDAIGFDLGPSATIALDSQLPNITDAAEVAIDGGSADIAVSGQNSVRAFWVDSGSKLALHNLTVTGAWAVNVASFLYGGGAIHNDGGEVRVTQSTFYLNKGAGIGGGAISTDGGEVAVSDSTFSENESSNSYSGGGGIYSKRGTLTVSDSAFSGNYTTGSDDSGGAIYAEESLVTVVNSTFAGNTATDQGGGMALVRLLDDADTVEHHTVTNSTFSGNGTSWGDGANIAWCLGIDQHGGCNRDNTPDLTLANTIVANGFSASSGSAVSAENCNWSVGSAVDGGNNISNDGSCGFQAANDSLSNTDPLLDPNGFPSGLQDNGGPTKTIALMEGSPAIDAIPEGTNGCATDITQDQRGVIRPQGPACDVGAFEAPPDESAPDAPTIASPAEGSLNVDSFTVSGTAQVNTVVELFEGSDSIGTDNTDFSGNWSIDLSAVSEGSHSYTAKATDRAGNVSSESAARTVMVDMTQPRVEEWTPKGKKVRPTAKPAVTFSEAMDEGSVEATDGDGVPTTIVLKKGSVQVAATAALDEGGEKAILTPARALKRGATYTVTVTPEATDVVGHRLDQDPSFSGNQAKSWSFKVKR